MQLSSSSSQQQIPANGHPLTLIITYSAIMVAYIVFFRGKQNNTGGNTKRDIRLLAILCTWSLDIVYKIPMVVLYPSCSVEVQYLIHRRPLRMCREVVCCGLNAAQIYSVLLVFTGSFHWPIRFNLKLIKFRSSVHCGMRKLCVYILSAFTQNQGPPLSIRLFKSRFRM